MSKYQKMTALSIGIDPGHGGIDPGALGPTGIREADITLEISLLLADQLRERGHSVVLTRLELFRSWLALILLLSRNLGTAAPILFAAWPTSCLQDMLHLMQRMLQAMQQISQIRGDIDEIQDTSNLNRRFNRIMHLFGRPEIRFHDLRHTCATLFMAAGVDAKKVQEILGHESIRTTLDVYGHVLPSMQREAVDRMNDFMGR